MPQPLADRIALVTGASRGIGRATAVSLARAGAHVVAVGRTHGALEEIDDAVQAAGSTATLVPLDMRDYPGIYRLAAALNERYQRLDVLVGNAGGRRPTLAARSRRAAELGRGHGGQCHRQLAPDPRHGSACSSARRPAAPCSSRRAPRPMPAPMPGPIRCRRRRSTRWRGPTPMRRPRRRSASICSIPARRAPACGRLVMPGEDPMTLPTPEQVAEKIVDLCLPSFTETGKLYDFRAGKLLEFMPPA